MRYLLLAIVATISFTGCKHHVPFLKTKVHKKIVKKVKKKPIVYEKPTAAKLVIFKKTMTEVAFSTQDDSRYKRMTLDTPEKKKWFKDLMFRLWDRQITRKQFMREGLKKYPTHAYEFNFVINGFQRRS